MLSKTKAAPETNGAIVTTSRNPIPDFDCTNPVHRAKVVGDHGIFEDDLKALIRNFFGNDTIAFKILSIDEMIGIIGTDITECTSCDIVVRAGQPKVQVDAGNPSDNTDILVEKDCSRLYMMSSYSYSLFKGVIELYAPDVFAFSKARKEGKNTLVFKAYQSADPSVIYFGDLSELYP